jgi:hypothetical protein
MSVEIDDDDELLWSGRAIGQAIGKTEKATLHMLERGKIRSAVKRGKMWSAWRRQLRAEFGMTDRRPVDDVGDDVQVNGGA